MATAQGGESETGSKWMMETDEEYACIMKGLWIHHLDNEGVEQYQLCQWRNTVARIVHESSRETASFYSLY